MNFEKIQALLKYKFKRLELLKIALTHRSVGACNNERLEFLGDAILGLVITDELFHRFPQATEGQLSRLRANLVKGKTLVSLAKYMQLENFVCLGEGEINNHYRGDSILGDLIESLIGAIYLDGGLQNCRTCVLSWYSYLLRDASIDEQCNKDFKTRLQEWLQSRKADLPQYRLVENFGLAHQQFFRVECKVNDLPAVIGEGTSRRSAEQQAAQKILIVAGVKDDRK